MPADGTFRGGGAPFPGAEVLTPRWLCSLGVALCAVLLGVALYFQHVMHLEPCPLCMVQRVLVIALAVILTAAALHDPEKLGRRVYGALIILVGLAGATVAGRHVYLQNLPPDRVPECGPGLEYILDVFPLSEALGLIFRGSGECAEVQWAFLGLTIPGWTLLAFIGCVLLGAMLCAMRRPASRRAQSAGIPAADQ